MANQINKTAQEITKHFFEVTGLRTTPAIFSKTIMQARTLLDSSYTKDEIIKAIDYIVEHPFKAPMTSLGYVSYCINEVLQKIKVMEVKEEFRQFMPTQEEQEGTNVNNSKVYQNLGRGIRGTTKF